MRYADVFHDVLDVLRRCRGHMRYHVGNTEVDQGTDCAESIRLDTQEPVRGHVAQVRRAGDEHDALVLEYVQQGHAQAGNHTCDRAFLVHPLVEDAHHQRGEYRRCCQAERQGDGASREVRRVEAEIAGEQDREGHCDTAGQQFLLLGDFRFEHAFEQVMGYRRGYRQQ